MIKLKVMFLTSLLFGVIGCTDFTSSIGTQATAHDPQAVARAFWNEYVTGTFPKELSIDPTAKSRIKNNDNQRIILGTMNEIDSKYYIESTYVTVDENNNTIRVPFLTVVGSSGGRFVVDYNASIDSTYEHIVNISTKQLNKDLTLANTLFKDSIPSGNEKTSDSFYKWTIGGYKKVLNAVDIKPLPEKVKASE